MSLDITESSVDISDVSSLSSDFLDVQTKSTVELQNAVNDSSLEEEDDKSEDNTFHGEHLTVNTLQDAAVAHSPQDEEDYSEDTAEDADGETTESVHGSSKEDSAWIDADSVTDSLRDLKDQRSILSHFQHLYQIESCKSKQRRKEQIRSTNKQIRSFSLSPNRKFSRSTLLRMKSQQKESGATNEVEPFSAEHVHERRFLKRKLSEEKYLAAKVKECTFKPEIDPKSSKSQQNRSQKNFLHLVQEDIEERKSRRQRAQQEKQMEIEKAAPFQPQISRQYDTDSPRSKPRDDVFLRLSGSPSPNILKRKTRGYRQDSKRLIKNHGKATALFTSPHRIEQISNRLYEHHEKMELKRQARKRNVEREEEEKRDRSKVLGQSRKIIVNAFLGKFKNVILGMEPDLIIENMTEFTYQQMEAVLTEIGFCSVNGEDHRIKQLIALLDPQQRQSVRWGDVKRLFRAIPGNKNESKEDRDLYAILQKLYTNKLLRKSTSNPKRQRVGGKTKKSSDALSKLNKKWDSVVEKRHRKIERNEALKRQMEEEKLQQQLKECTFAPQINTKKRPRNDRMQSTRCSTVDEFGNSQPQSESVDMPRYKQLYEDALDRKQRHKAKVKQREREMANEIEAYSFKPAVNKKSVSHLESQKDPEGFDQAVLRMAEGRIRNKQEEIQQEYQQKKMSLQWQKRAKWLKRQKQKEDSNRVVCNANA